jgi:PhoPQ-activated pathogenicity-related protein
VTTSNDEFFLPDDSHYYFNDLPADKYLRILVNAEHSLTDHRISFYLSVLYNYPRPDIRWERETTSNGGKITLYVNNAKPLVIAAYHATTMDGIRY